jgi:DNA-binding transcriptional LysR family regulator
MPSTQVPKPLNFRTLDLNLLRVFDEVMAERSLTRAARHLSLTQPAVSNALRRLRETLGDELVVRAGQGMTPTPRALALWPTVRAALGQLQASLSPSGFQASTATTTFVLAMADATAAELMPGLIDVLERQAPGVSMRVVPLTTRDPRSLLDEGKADMAVGHFPSVLADLVIRPSAPLCWALRVRDALWPPTGAWPTDAGQVLRRTPHAGQLFRPALWVY